MRSNRAGIGTRLPLRVLDHWSIADSLDPQSSPGQSLQPILFGLGGRSSADYIALDWSDGVFQTELDLGARELHLIAETQRQLSSCPVIFAAASAFATANGKQLNNPPRYSSNVSEARAGAGNVGATTTRGQDLIRQGNQGLCPALDSGVDLLGGDVIPLAGLEPLAESEPSKRS